MLYCIRKNISNLLKKQKLLTAIILFTQIVSVTAILFSYGIINHYHVKNQITDGRLMEIDIQFERGESTATAGDLKKIYHNLFGLAEQKLDYIYVMAGIEKSLIDATTDYKNGKAVLDPEIKERTEENLVPGGRIYTEEEAQRGEKVLILSGKRPSESDEIVLGGETYRILGEQYLPFEGSEDMNFIMPFLSLPDSAKLRHIFFHLNVPLNEKEHKEMTDMVVNMLDDKVIIPKFEGIRDIENTKSNNTAILAGMLLIVFAAVNYCIMYRYILERRKKMLAVFRICGCSKGRGIRMYLAELLGMSLLVFLVMVPVYHFWILPVIGKRFEYVTDFYSRKQYLQIGAVYSLSLLAAYVILITKMVVRTPVMLSKEGEI